MSRSPGVAAAPQAALTCPEQLFFHQDQAERLEEDVLDSALPSLLSYEGW